MKIRHVLDVMFKKKNKMNKEFIKTEDDFKVLIKTLKNITKFYSKYEKTVKQYKALSTDLKRWYDEYDEVRYISVDIQQEGLIIVFYGLLDFIYVSFNGVYDLTEIAEVVKTLPRTDLEFYNFNIWLNRIKRRYNDYLKHRDIDLKRSALDVDSGEEVIIGKYIRDNTSEPVIIIKILNHDSNIDEKRTRYFVYTLETYKFFVTSSVAGDVQNKQAPAVVYPCLENNGLARTRDGRENMVLYKPLLNMDVLFRISACVSLIEINELIEEQLQKGQNVIGVLIIPNKDNKIKAIAKFPFFFGVSSLHCNPGISETIEIWDVDKITNIDEINKRASAALEERLTEFKEPELKEVQIRVTESAAREWRTSEELVLIVEKLRESAAARVAEALAERGIEGAAEEAAQESLAARERLLEAERERASAEASWKESVLVEQAAKRRLVLARQNLRRALEEENEIEGKREDSIYAETAANEAAAIVEKNMEIVKRSELMQAAFAELAEEAERTAKEWAERLRAESGNISGGKLLKYRNRKIRKTRRLSKGKKVRTQKKPRVPRNKKSRKSRK
jgi:hypothetical protein